MANVKAQMAQELREAPLAIIQQEQALARPLADLVRRLKARPPQVVVTCARGSSAHAGSVRQASYRALRRHSRIAGGAEHRQHLRRSRCT